MVRMRGLRKGSFFVYFDMYIFRKKTVQETRPGQLEAPDEIATTRLKC